jgi:hypothetical protein
MVGGVAAAPGAAVGEPTPLVVAGDNDLYFSPDGDGKQDRARFEFSLSRTSAVRVLIRDDRERLVRNERLGSLEPGRHLWRWNGESTAGRVLPDGDYVIVVRAWSRQRSGEAWTATRIVTVPDAGRVVLSRPVVYPAATAVYDRLAVSYIRARYYVDEAEFPGYSEEVLPPTPLRTRLVIKAPDSERVQVSYRRAYRPSFFWSARDEEGNPLPPGTYALRVTVRDPVGHVRTIRRSVEVSSAQLAEQVWTATIPAATTSPGSAPVYDPHCLGCGESCGPVPSERFAGGLSFRQPCSIFTYWPARAYFGARAPVRPAPVDSFRVTATGGPTTPGETDVANFDGIPMGPGDVAVSTPWTPVEPTRHPYLPDARQPMNWGFSTSMDNNYDVASFTVEYRYYAPVP